jgi:glycosyltransferase involved in cell wall biosynthesis
MKVLLTVTSIRLAYGGPAVSVVGLAEALFAAGLDVAIWSPDAGDVGSAATTTIPDLQAPRRLEGNINEAWASFGRPDIIHDNGIWLPHNHRIATMTGQQGLARVVSTRGMLSPWALRHKGIKKKLAWLLYQKRDLEDLDLIHATSEEEACDLGALGLARSVSVIPNGMHLTEQQAHFPFAAPTIDQRAHTLKTMLYLGRIYPVKGLPLLLDAWSDVRPNNWRLLIVGPDEGGHRSELEAQCRRLGLEGSVEFQDAVSGAKKENIYRQADIFVLPSLSESFGMSVAEAMAYGLPVIASTAAPWPIISEENIGWWVNPTRPDLAHAVRAATTTPPATLKAMGQRASDHVRSDLSWKVLVPRYVEMYERAISLKRQTSAS